jgi:hypothetical protein
MLGKAVGSRFGTPISNVGICVGNAVGAFVGAALVSGVGKHRLYVGARVGSMVGMSVGISLGMGVGAPYVENPTSRLLLVAVAAMLSTTVVPVTDSTTVPSAISPSADDTTAPTLTESAVSA